MSYCFDVLATNWEMLKAALPEGVRDSEITARFGFLLEELHDCDHRLRGQINRDERVTAAAHRLQRAGAEPE